MATVDQIFTQSGLWKWYNAIPTQSYNGVGEKGYDFSLAYGTPIGSVSGGRVVAVFHNNNSINDVVQVVDANGAVWHYQHITANVRIGQTINVGTIIGTQNGTPVDQYSTGSHIEVRYAPNYIPGISPWLQPWQNPASAFRTVGGTVGIPGQGGGIGGPGQYGGGGKPPPGGGTTGGVNPGGGLGQTLNGGPPGPGGILPVSYNGFYYYPLIEQVHETLINTPGFYGIAIALDEAEKFPGYIDLTLPATPLTIGGGSVGGVSTPSLNTGLTMPDVNGIVRSVGASITDNALPFAIRANVALLGVVLLIALFIKPVASVVREVSPLGG